MKTIDVIKHYDALIDENNDPVHDSAPLCEYMDKWDGQRFIDELQLDSNKSVLEIGVGTGRLAIKVVSLSKSFTGIDVSHKTVERAKENLSEYKNVNLICDDFFKHNFNERFDVIYSSLTFMHFKDKQKAIQKISDLLKPGGRFVMSIDKNQNTFINNGIRKLKVYPDNPNEISKYIKAVGLIIESKLESEFAYIFVCCN